MTPRTTAITAPAAPRRLMTWALVGLMLASFFSSFFLSTPASAQSADTELASAVPATSVLYMGLDLNQESDQWKQAMTLIERSGLNDLSSSQTGTSTTDMANNAEAMNFTGSAAVVFTDANALVESGTTDVTNVAATTTMDPTTATQSIPNGFAVVFKPADAAGLQSQLDSQVKSEADANNATVQTTDYNGVTITYWESTDPSVAPTAVANVDGTLVMAVRPADVEPIIDAVQGKVDNLADSETFTNVRGAFTENTLVFGYMNMTEMLKAVVASGEVPQSEAVQMQQAYGVVGWTVYASQDGFHYDTAYLPEDASQYADTPTFDPTMASIAPANSLVFMNGNDLSSSGLDQMIVGMMQMAMASYSTVSAGTPGAMTTPVATPSADDVWTMLEQQLGFNPKTDLLDKLDGEWAAFGNINSLDASTGQVSYTFLFASETSDPTTVASSAEKITNLLQQQGDSSELTTASRTVGDGTVTTVTFAGGENGQDVVIEYGVVNGHLVIGTPDAIDSFASGQTSTLEDDPTYTSTMNLLPKDNLTGVSYMNIQTGLLPLLDQVAQMSSSATSAKDADEACADYASQEEAQAAYDADTSGLWNLDMNFDGRACEDYFGAASPEASPISATQQVNIVSAGGVTWVDGDMMRSSSILVIGN